MDQITQDRARRRIVDYRMIWRWHFYAGLICIPFVLILSITGPIYLFKPQIEALIDRPYDGIGRRGYIQPLSAQVEGALAAFPNARFRSVEIRTDPTDAARVILNENGEKLRVYIHPETLSVLKSVPEEARFMNVVKTIHGELFAGLPGTLMVETAASWALVMIITGLYLWWPRNAKGLAGVLWPRLQGGRVFWRDLHAVTGIWVSLFAIGLLLTGLPWTTVWGAGFKSFRQAVSAQSPKPDWSTSRAADNKDAHAGHAGHGAIESASSRPYLLRLDAMAVRLRAENLPPPVWLTAPDPDTTPAKSGNWQGVSQTQNQPASVTVDFNEAGQIVKTRTFSDKPLIDRALLAGISLHEGQLFGPLNQALGVLTAAGLITLCISAVIMWWKRRPDEARLGAPRKLSDQKLGAGLVVLILSLCLFLPMMGLSLLIAGVIEWMVLRRIPKVRDWLGLSVQKSA